MTELLLELLSEEIPARMQAQAAADLKRLVTDALADARLSPEALETYVTPRRLTLVAHGMPASQPDMDEERRGPKVGAPDKALEGFLGATGLTKEQLEIREAGKDQYYFAVISHQGRAAKELLPELLQKAIISLPWPKSMRWGDRDFSWVRPLKSMICLLDGSVLPLQLGHLEAGDMTEGHRFLGNGPFSVKNFSDYCEKLRENSVLLDREERKARIRKQKAACVGAEGLHLVEDDALLEEVAGLVEWPNTYLGHFDNDFMAVPPEVLRSEMRAHQKYFSLQDKQGNFAPAFLVVSNMQPEDGGAQIILGNERVLRARLSDARFFWDQDRKTPLDQRTEDLSRVIFHAKLGSLADKTSRITALAKFLAVWVPHAGLEDVERAAHLCKADLVTEMVGEFPDLQGVMGRYYAREQGESEAVSNAIGEHYSPQGPGDECPKAPVSVAISLADKIDTLVGLFAADEKPTGSKDPFALRRAALGSIRLILENRLRVPLRLLFEHALKGYPSSLCKGTDRNQVVSDLLTFFADRLKVMLKENGYRHDHIAAVFADGSEDDLARLVRRVDALAKFLSGNNGENLLAAYRRAANILRIEEKKDGTNYDGKPSAKLLEQEEETALHKALQAIAPEIKGAMDDEAYDDAMTHLASLRGPVDAFFDQVTVNSDKADLRANRLKLLSQLRDGLEQVANFGALEG